MSRVAEMQKEAESHSVKFLELTRIFGRNKDLYACVFEGEDEKYFSPRLNFFLGEHCWSAVNSGGKKITTELHTKVLEHPEYKNYKYAFFVDRDYEHWLESPEKNTFYITDCYSIENLYTSVGTFKSILSAEFGVNEQCEEREDFAKCVELFESAMKKFCECVSSFNYYAKAHRIMERDGKKKIKLNIRNVKLSDLAKIEIENVTMQYDPLRPDALFKDLQDTAVDHDSMREAVDTLPEEEWQTLFRGKQQLEFLRLFLTHLKNDRNDKTPRYFGKSGNVRLGLSKENCISELSQYASTPSSLKHFLERLSSRKLN